MQRARRLRRREAGGRAGGLTFFRWSSLLLSSCAAQQYALQKKTHGDKLLISVQNRATSKGARPGRDARRAACCVISTLVPAQPRRAAALSLPIQTAAAPRAGIEIPVVGVEGEDDAGKLLSQVFSIEARGAQSEGEQSTGETALCAPCCCCVPSSSSLNASGSHPPARPPPAPPAESPRDDR